MLQQQTTTTKCFKKNNKMLLENDKRTRSTLERKVINAQNLINETINDTL